MGEIHGPKIVREGLVLALDAADINSYPGTGTTWYDLSGNNYHLTLNSAAVWNNAGGASYMDFENGIAKYLPGGTLTDIPGTGGIGTICIYSTIKAPDTDWKTLTRAAVGEDHNVIINAGDGVSLGMYDNSGATGFNDSGYDVSSIPDRTTQFHYMVWRLSSTDPYYRFYYDDNLSSPVAQITASTAEFDNGFASVGAYHNGSSSPTSFSQEFGKMAMFIYYDRHLTDNELRQNYNAFKGRFGL